MKTKDFEEIKAGWADAQTPEFRAGVETARRELLLGMRVRELRLAAGLSQSALARLVGTRQPNIARLEAGGGMPKVETLERVAEALDADLVVAIVPRTAA